MLSSVIMEEWVLYADTDTEAALCHHPASTPAHRLRPMPGRCARRLRLVSSFDPRKVQRSELGLVQIARRGRSLVAVRGELCGFAVRHRVRTR